MAVQVQTLDEVFGPGAQEAIAEIGDSYEKLYRLLGLFQERQISQREFFVRLFRGGGIRPLWVQIRHDASSSEMVWVVTTRNRRLRISTNADGESTPRITFWVRLSEKRRLSITRTEAWFRPRDEAGGEVQLAGDYVPTCVIGQGYSKRETAEGILRAFLRATPPPERDERDD